MITIDRGTGHDSDDTTLTATPDDNSSIDNVALLFHGCVLGCVTSKDSEDQDDLDGSASNLTDHTCLDCIRRTHRQVRMMQRWATTTKNTLPSP